MSKLNGIVLALMAVFCSIARGRIVREYKRFCGNYGNWNGVAML